MFDSQSGDLIIFFVLFETKVILASPWDIRRQAPAACRSATRRGPIEDSESQKFPATTRMDREVLCVKAWSSRKL